MAGLSHPKERFRISPIDCRGRGIEPVVLSVAQEIANRIFQHAERMFVDPAVATSLLEEAAVAVSRVLRCRPNGQNGIRDLQAYLFSAFIRRLKGLKRKEMRLVASSADDLAGREQFDPSRELEMRILANELLTRCDGVVRDMFYRRVVGFSWKEIGAAYGISAHAAESRFSQALRRLRKKLPLDDAEMRRSEY